MTADFPKDPTEARNLMYSLERIRKECPSFIAWLEKSIEETVDIITDTQSIDMRAKQSGALKDLLAISRLIANPPQGQVGEG